jgi:hypothetical protein
MMCLFAVGDVHTATISTIDQLTARPFLAKQWKYAAMVQEAPRRIIRVSSKSKSGSGWCMELLDIEVSMGAVPRQESVSNSSMHHRELLKWHG